jgi:3-hydroxyacyl-[acyl-carrier-protein] dehydratase
VPRIDYIVDPATVDCSIVIDDIEGIRATNPQRFEMEQLTAILVDDGEREICIGYKDVAEDEFWARGHMPDMPLMPGVLMCEAAAQLSSYYATKHDLMAGYRVGFGALDSVKFRGMVQPGDRLLIVLQKTKGRVGQLVVCKFQAFVDNNLVCEGVIKGIPLPHSLD